MAEGPDRNAERDAALKAAHGASQACGLLVIATLVALLTGAGLVRAVLVVPGTTAPWYGHPLNLATGVAWGLGAVLAVLAGVDLEKAAPEGRTSSALFAFRRLARASPFLAFPHAMGFAFALIRLVTPATSPPGLQLALLGLAAALTGVAGVLVARAWWRHRETYRDLASVPDAGRSAVVVKIRTLSDDLERKGCVIVPLVLTLVAAVAAAAAAGQ